MNLIDLPFETIDNNTFDCYLQQIVSLCKYHYNEYFKLLLDEEISFDEDVIVTRSKYNENLSEFYGIELKRSDSHNIHPNDRQMFLCVIDLHHYPPCDNLSSYDAGAHNIILHGETETEYIVFDNFYEKRNYPVPKELVKKGLINLWEIYLESDIQLLDQIHKSSRMTNCFEEYCNNYIIDMYIHLYHQMPKYIDTLSKMEKRLVANIQLMFGFLDRNASFLDGYLYSITKDKQNPLTDELKSMVRRIMQKWYLLFKKRMKYGFISYEDFNKALEDIILILCPEKEIKNAILTL